MNIRSCQNCMFWQSHGEHEDGLEERGECRRNAPTRFSADLGAEARDIHGPPDHAIFPITYYDGWCGEHQSIGGDDPRETRRYFADASINASLNIERSLNAAADRIKKELLEEIEKRKQERGDQ